MENPNSLKEAMALADLRIKKGYWKTVLLRSLRAVIKRTTEPFVSIHDRYGINASRDTNFALTKYDQMAGEYRKKVNERNNKNAAMFLAIKEDNAKVCFMHPSEYYEKLWAYMADTIGDKTPGSVLEIGAGEFTTLVNVVRLIRQRGYDIQAGGLDISWSSSRSQFFSIEAQGLLGR
jgi:hypothetical protein